ncbi:hypothetical protein BJ138DRAFT_1117263, partial [Hygrophoropsis aurantiaca]
QATNTAHERTIAALQSQLSKSQSTHEHVILPHSQEKPQLLLNPAAYLPDTQPDDTDSSTSPPPVPEPGRRQSKAAAPPPIHIVRPAYNPRYRHTYGYYASRECMLEAVFQLRPDIEEECEARDRSLASIRARAAAIIGVCMGIHGLTTLFGLDPQDISIPQECIENSGAVRLLSICTDEEDRFTERPSQERVEALTKLLSMKQEPRWWRAFDTRSAD